MSQYLLAVYGSEDDVELSPEDMQRAYAQVDEFNSQIQDSGAWVFGGGLEAVDTATVVDASGSNVTVTDGPFAEAKEHIGGFWVIEAPDLDAALALAETASAACMGAVEVRPFQDE